MSEYTVAELRSSLRRILEEAKVKKTFVRRYDDVYEIKPLKDRLTKDKYVEAWKKDADKAKKNRDLTKGYIEAWEEGPKNDVVAAKALGELNFCKHDAVKGFCKKGCK